MQAPLFSYPVIRLMALISLSLWGMTSPILACQICIPYPKKSTADYLIESPTVALAREDPNRPFHYSAIEILRGNPKKEAIDLFLDSSTHRLLSLHPKHSILLIQPEGDAPTWLRVSLVNEVTEPIIRQILKQSPDWEKKQGARAAFFAEYLGHPDPLLRTMAHLELAKAPYSQIRKYAHVLSRDQIRSFLKDLRYSEWHSLYILLLARNPSTEDKELIRRSVNHCAKYGFTSNLSAWATALIEIDPEEGITYLTTNYLRIPNRGRSAEELRAVLMALSIHGNNGSEEMKNRIILAYQASLEKHPRTASVIVNDLNNWKNKELGETIAQIITTEPSLFDLTTTLQLRSYARKALSDKW